MSHAVCELRLRLRRSPQPRSYKRYSHKLGLALAAVSTPGRISAPYATTPVVGWMNCVAPAVSAVTGLIPNAYWSVRLVPRKSPQPSSIITPLPTIRDESLIDSHKHGKPIRRVKFERKRRVLIVNTICIRNQTGLPASRLFPDQR